jgi:hypothetical protein
MAQACTLKKALSSARRLATAAPPSHSRADSIMLDAAQLPRRASGAAQVGLVLRS